MLEHYRCKYNCSQAFESLFFDSCKPAKFYFLSIISSFNSLYSILHCDSLYTWVNLICKKTLVFMKRNSYFNITI